MLTVLEKTDMRNSKGQVLWRCLCDCGKEYFGITAKLVSGHVKSCGCKLEYNQKHIYRELHRLDGTCIEKLGMRKGYGNTGIAGVHMNARGKYVATVTFQRRRYRLGSFSTLEEAVKARERGLEIHYDYLDKFYDEHPEVKRKDIESN